MSNERLVYLDNNATTRVAPEVVEAMLPCLTEHWGNPSSAYDLANAPSRMIAEAREQVAKLIGADKRTDLALLKVESDELVEAARANGATVEYVLFPDEGHGFQKRENRITASEAYVDFLNTYLKGEPAQQQEDGGEDIAAD